MTKILDCIDLSSKNINTKYERLKLPMLMMAMKTAFSTYLKNENGEEISYTSAGSWKATFKK